MNSMIAELVKQAEGIVVPYSDEYEAAHTRFAQKMWPQKHRRHVPEYVRWKFRGPEKGVVNGLLLAVLDGKVIGQLGVIPAMLQVGEEIYPAQWACDLMVDTDVRRQKIGSKLFAVAMARPLVTLGSDPNPEALALETRLGFRVLDGPRQMILPLNPQQAIKERLPKRLQPLLPALTIVARPFVMIRSRELRKTDFQPPANVGRWQDVAQLIQAQRIPVPHIVHDTSFLEWRCQGLSGFSPALESVFTESGAFAVFQATPLQFFIYEWAAGSFAEARSLFQRITQLALEHHSQTIVVNVNSADEQAWLGKLGFFTRHTPIPLIYYPEKSLGHFKNFHYCLYDSDGNI